MNDTAQNVRVKTVSSRQIADLIRIADATNLSPWTAQNFLDELKNPDAVILSLEHQTMRTIGFIVGRITNGKADNDEADIFNIAVIESEQGKGNGQILFNAFLRYCFERQAACIWLEVRQSNKKAIDFYVRNGFEPVQHRPNFYENPREHAVLMRRKLK